jgi:hypothetical protein
MKDFDIFAQFYVLSDRHESSLQLECRRILAKTCPAEWQDTADGRSYLKEQWVAGQKQTERPPCRRKNASQQQTSYRPRSGVFAAQNAQQDAGRNTCGNDNTLQDSLQEI